MHAVASLQQFRTGRNYVRVGDTVKVSPPHRRSFFGKVLRIRGDDENNATEVDVSGPRGWHTVTPERITRTRKKSRGDDE